MTRSARDTARADRRRAVARRWLQGWADEALDGFAAHPPAVRAAIARFFDGYRAALADAPVADDPFAVEGAGMGLAALDGLDPEGPSALAAAFCGPRSHDVLRAVGAGCAVARLRRPAAARGVPDCLDASVADGRGFMTALMHAPEAAGWRTVEPARDRGVGRGLWFAGRADPVAIAARIAQLPEARRPAVWGGVAFAAVFAGGLGRDAVPGHFAEAPSDALLRGAHAAVALKHAFADSPTGDPR